MKQPLKFDTAHIPLIEQGKKRLTIRWDMDTGLRSGHGIKLINSHNNQIFGTAIVLDTYEMRVAEMINTEWEYHSNYANLAQFQSEFGVYYDKIFAREDIVDVIEWGDTFTSNRFYES